MILVDTSVWIDHLHASESHLVELLEADTIGCHPYVIEELALGSIKHRHAMLSLLAQLHPFPVLTHTEVLSLVDVHALWGRGLSAVDVHLLGSALIVGSPLWTRDKRLIAASNAVGVPHL